MIFDDELLFSEFEDLLDKNEKDVNDLLPNDLEEDTIVHKLDASALLLNDLLTEMERRGLHPRGFFEDDAKVLQAEFDKEHESYVESKRIEKIEARKIEEKQATIQKRKMIMETQLAEERNELEKDEVLKENLSLVASSTCKEHLRIEINDISVRSLAKAIWYNNNVKSLDVSNMNISDLSGSYICRALRKNRSIIKLELGGNNCGPKTCLSLGDSLKINNVVTYVSLESNLLTNGLDDKLGMESIATMLSVNNTLKHLSVWGCNINSEGCKMLADNLSLNKSLISFDLFYNDWEQDQINVIYDRLKQNCEIEAEKEKLRETIENKKQAKASMEQKRIEARKREEEEKIWIEDQNRERSQARLVELEKLTKEKQEKMEKSRDEHEVMLNKVKSKVNSKNKKNKKKKRK